MSDIPLSAIVEQEEITPEEARSILWRKGSLLFKLDANQIELYNIFKNSISKTVVWGCSRRLGKCLEEGTEVLTPNGPVKIENLKIGDTVYGYNKDCSVSKTKVINTFIQGVKEVVELKNNTRKLAASTEDHTWLTYNTSTKKISEKKVSEFTKDNRTKIIREFVNIPCGEVNESHAYAIGALLGDGCSKQGVKDIHISSENDEVPKKIASILNCNFFKQSENNFTYVISNGKKVFGKGKQDRTKKIITCNYYDEWCKNRYAHEKIVDFDIVNKWNRYSALEFLAGLLDTDGSIGVNSNILTIQFGSQSYSIVDAFCKLFFKLFQYKPTITKDKRTKYVNGPFYQVNIRNNLFNKRALKELSHHLSKEKKKWKPQYENLLENNTNKKFSGYKLGKKYKTQTYDITVDNKTNLYLLANGLVTHNSYTLCTVAIETCLQKKNAIVKLLAPKQKDIKSIIRPLMRQLIADAPEEIRPIEKSAAGIWFFPSTGSQIQMAGCDNGRAESVRGSNADLCIIDEAGFVSSDLEYIVNSILLPTTTTTKGKILLASTPPKSSTHEFVYFVNKAKAEKSYVHKTIFDNPRLTKADIDLLAKASGGYESVTFRREYLAQFITDQSRAIVPEFADVKHKIVKVWQRPAFFDTYVAMDVGMKDLTVVLFAYFDFRSNKLIIEDELVINGQKFTTDALAKGIKEKESSNFQDKFTGELKEPLIRVSDNNLILINDLFRLHGILFRPTRKDDADAALNNMRILIKDENIIINPKCEILIHHLDSGIWNKSKTSFDRSGDDGHFDAIDSLKYLVRNIDFTKNPYPAGYGLPQGFDVYYNRQQSTNVNIFKKIMNIK